MKGRIEKIVSLRWLLWTLIFLILVCCKCSFSSIGIYNNYFPTKIVDSSATIFGQPRAIRTDEWAVQVPIFFSQQYNDYKLNSNQMSISDTNMVMDYYAPTKDLSVLGKPFSWGYILFGNEIGLSWYWSMMIVLFFAVSFEMFYIITENNVRISIIGMFMIALSPAIQWWMMPHMPIVILYGMGLFCIGYYFFISKSIILRGLCTALSIVAVSGFAMSIFPSFQVPVLLIMGCLLIITLIRDKEDIVFEKKDILRLIIAVCGVLVILGYFLITSKDSISAVMNSVYPGKRVSTGNDVSLYNIFTDLMSIFLPYRDSNILNNSEVATYIHFAPFFILLFPRISNRLKSFEDKNWMIGITLFWAILIEIIFMGLGFPVTLAKLTMFKYANRMKLIYGFTATLFTIWSIFVLFKYKDILKKWEKVCYPILYGGMYLMFIDDTLLGYISKYIIILEIIMFVGCLILICFNYKKLFTYLMIAIMIFAGATVNPLEIGIDAITNHPIYEYVRSVVDKDPDAVWASIDCDFQLSNYLLACGAKTLDSTNFYKDYEKWELLDPANEFDFQTNRYTNEKMELSNDCTSVELIADDQILININPEDLKKINVTYILTKENYSKMLNKYGIKSDLEFEEDGYKIYKLEY